MNSDELIIEAVKRKLEQGDFTEIINKHISIAIDEVVKDLFKKGWGKNDNGKCYELIREAISPILVSAVEQSDIEAMAAQTKETMGAIIRKSSVGSFCENMAGALALFESKEEEFKFGEELPLERIFQKYIASITLDKDFCDDHDLEYEEGSIDLTYRCEVKRREDFYDDTMKYVPMGRDDVFVRFYIEEIDNLCDEELSDEYSVKFRLVRDYMGRYRIDSNAENITLGDLRYMNKLTVYLALAANRYMDITDIKDMEKYESVSIYE